MERFESQESSLSWRERVQEQARLVLAQSTLNERDFIDEETAGYRADEVELDRARVSVLEKKFEDSMRASDNPLEARNTKLDGELFEALMLWNGEQNGWLGWDARVLKTSKFDDYVNGIDLIVEFQKEEVEKNILGLALDVTFSSHPDNVTKKFSRILTQLERGHLMPLKYYEGEGRGDHEVAEAIVAVSRDSVREVGRLTWEEKKHKTVSEHPIQLRILTQIVEQMDIYAEYARAK